MGNRTVVKASGTIFTYLKINAMGMVHVFKFVKLMALSIYSAYSLTIFSPYDEPYDRSIAVINPQCFETIVFELLNSEPKIFPVKTCYSFKHCTLGWCDGRQRKTIKFLSELTVVN